MGHVALICRASPSRIAEMLRPFVLSEKVSPPHPTSETTTQKSSVLAVRGNSRLTLRGTRGGGERFTWPFSPLPGVMLIAFIIGVPIAVIVMFVRFPVLSLDSVYERAMK